MTHQPQEPTGSGPDQQEAADAEARKKRRTGYKLIAIGAGFFAVGVFLYAAGNPWPGVLGMAFGFMGIAGGIAEALGSTTSAARIALIVSSAAFAITGAIALTSGIVAPEAWGWRGRGAGIFAGLLCLGLGAPATVILTLRELRIRRNQRERD